MRDFGLQLKSLDQTRCWRCNHGKVTRATAQSSLMNNDYDGYDYTVRDATKRAMAFVCV